MTAQLDRIERKLDLICGLMEKMASHQERLVKMAEGQLSSKTRKKEP